MHFWPPRREKWSSMLVERTCRRQRRRKSWIGCSTRCTATTPHSANRRSIVRTSVPPIVGSAWSSPRRKRLLWALTPRACEPAWSTSRAARIMLTPICVWQPAWKATRNASAHHDERNLGAQRVAPQTILVGLREAHLLEPALGGRLCR